MRFAEIPVLFYLIISGCHSGRHKPLLRTFTGTTLTTITANSLIANLQSNLQRGTSSHEMGFCHPIYLLKLTDKGENKIRCMRVLFSYQFSWLCKPAIIITEKEQFSECPNTLFIADLCHLKLIKRKQSDHAQFRLLS